MPPSYLGGVGAGIDLALALVEEDLGADIALSAARWMVVFAQRPGGQAQFSERLSLPTDVSIRIRNIVDPIVAEPAAHQIPELARRSGYSERQFARLFAQETQMTPARFVERVRVEAARELLERRRIPIEAIAHRSGFKNNETMRRAFSRILGVAPGAYRRHFTTQRTKIVASR